MEYVLVIGCIAEIALGCLAWYERRRWQGIALIVIGMVCLVSALVFAYEYRISEARRQEAFAQAKIDVHTANHELDKWRKRIAEADKVLTTEADLRQAQAEVATFKAQVASLKLEFEREHEARLAAESNL